MSNFKYYDLSGGVDMATSKMVLSNNSKKIYWSDAKNVEVSDAGGIKRMNGNVKLNDASVGGAILGMHEYKKSNNRQLVLTAADGSFNLFDFRSKAFIKKKEGLNAFARPAFTNFCNGIVVSNGVDEPFFFESGIEEEVKSCNATDSAGKPIRGKAMATYRGRVWIGDGSTLHYSALGKHDDWQTDFDAGYISNFHNDSTDIIALTPYKEYLAIHKEKQTYLLTGVSPTTFNIIPFADRGSMSPDGTVTIENSHYFFNNGVYTLEQIGELNQIRLSSELSKLIRPEFKNFDSTRLNEMTTLSSNKKHQVWFYFPYNGKQSFNTCWIYDYKNNAWFKREIPQNVTAGCEFDDRIYVGSDDGHIYQEDFGNSFDGAPIDFHWSSPYFSFKDPRKRKTVEDFYLFLNDGDENNFVFSTNKDFIDQDRQDSQHIFNVNTKIFRWDGDDWGSEFDAKMWNTNIEVSERASIYGSNKGVKLMINGDQPGQDFSLIGLEFNDVIFDEP